MFGYPVAPYGQNDIDDLQSIFEIPHLRGRAIFLNVQCKFYSIDRPSQGTWRSLNIV
jgi:regulator of nonsense transcripts 1